MNKITIEASSKITLILLTVICALTFIGVTLINKKCDDFWGFTQLTPYSYIIRNNCTGEYKEITSDIAKEIYEKVVEEKQRNSVI